MKGMLRSKTSPGVSGNNEITTAETNPARIARYVPLPVKFIPANFKTTVGPKAAPNAFHANNALSKIVAGIYNETSTDMTTKNATANLETRTSFPL